MTHWTWTRWTRTTWTGDAMSNATAIELVRLARRRFGRSRARLAVLICPVAVEKVVDNAQDAAESLRRLRKRLGIPSAGAQKKARR